MEDKIILYSNNCPRCNILKQKLNNSQITFTTCNDVSIMLEKGFNSMPMLEVNNKFMNFSEAIQWVNNIG